jgi:DNA-binding transcriptional regulator YdaS (Cro superfamily)
MRSAELVREFVDGVGGRARAARALDCSEALISQWLKGNAVSPRMALRIERASNGSIQKEALVWGDEA